MKLYANGFTLIELAVVLFVLGLLLSFSLAPIAAQQENRARNETIARLDQAIDALYGFALVHGRLPCPDAGLGAFGRENRLGDTACVAAEGALPHVTLALPAYDAWGRRLRYRVAAATEQPPEIGGNFVASDTGSCGEADGDLDLCSRGNIRVLTRGDDPASAGTENKIEIELASELPALVLSHGSNGFGALNPASPAAPVAHVDERENSDGDKVFFSRRYAAAQTPCRDNDAESLPACGFDDLVRWVVPVVLANRLVSAGRLP